MFDRTEWLDGLKVGDIVSVVSHFFAEDKPVFKISEKSIYVGDARRPSRFPVSDGKTSWESLQPSDDESKAERILRRTYAARVDNARRLLTADILPDALEKIEHILFPKE